MDFTAYVCTCEYVNIFILIFIFIFILILILILISVICIEFNCTLVSAAWCYGKVCAKYFSTLKHWIRGIEFFFGNTEKIHGEKDLKSD